MGQTHISHISPNSPLAIKDADGEYIEPVVDPDSSEGNMSPKENSLYVRPYQITKANNLVWNGLTFTRAHYLSPIGHDAFVNASADKNDLSTTVIYQNPGWPIEGNVGASSLD